MSNASLANKWREEAGTIMGLGRATAKETLIRRHNYKGEVVFQARRHWQTTRAGADAAKRRLAAAMAEFHDAASAEEQAELNALRAMGIGLNSRFPHREEGSAPTGGPPRKRGGSKSDEGQDSPPRRTATGGPRQASRRQTNIAAAWKSSDARAAWRAKMDKKGAIAPDTSAMTAPKPDLKPRRGGKAAASGFATT